MTRPGLKQTLPLPRRRITVEQYHRMREAGILREGDPTELIDGMLVEKNRSARGEDPMTVGKGHNAGVQRLVRLDARLRQHRCHMQVQGPLSLPPFDEPEPDGAVVMGELEDYNDRLPVAADLACVLEVSDSSLQHDRTIKLALYAAAGIPQYVIVNLVDHRVETFEQPVPGEGRYAASSTLRAGESVSLRVSGAAIIEVAVRELLP